MVFLFHVELTATHWPAIIFTLCLSGQGPVSSGFVEGLPAGETFLQCEPLLLQLQGEGTRSWSSSPQVCCRLLSLTLDKSLIVSQFPHLKNRDNPIKSPRNRLYND